MPTDAKGSNRLFIRSETADFTINFFSDAAGTIPVVPFDAGLYPAYEIFDVNNNVVQSGVGTPEVTAGRYKADFIVPPDAPLSNDIDCWRIEWVMVGTDERQIDFVEEFSIADTVITASETRELKFISLAGQEYRAIFRLPHEPHEVALDVYASTSNQLLTTVVSGVTGGLQVSTDGDSVVYYYDLLPAVTGVNCFVSLIWKVREAPIEPFSFVYQSLTYVTAGTLNLATGLRMLVDKLQKRLGTAAAYEDSDLVEYLVRGTELVNSAYPVTYYSVNGGLPGALTVYVILFSAWYALQAQRLLAVDLGFSFSGQSVTLDFDHSSGLADVASSWQDFINNGLPAAKMGILRATSSVGNVSGRGYKWNLSNFTYKVSSSPQGSNQILSQLQTLGILF